MNITQNFTEINCFNLTEDVAAYERLWFFSDEFGCKSLEKYFKNQLNDGYHFDTTSFTNSVISDNPSVIGRMGNLMRNAITATQNKGNKIMPLP